MLGWWLASWWRPRFELELFQAKLGGIKFPPEETLAP
jgi:hypothetical protein